MYILWCDLMNGEFGFYFKMKDKLVLDVVGRRDELLYIVSF